MKRFRLAASVPGRHARTVRCTMRALAADATAVLVHRPVQSRIRMNTKHRSSASARTRCVVAAILAAASLGGCRSEVAFYEKAAFAEAVMDMREEPMETHWYAKVHFSLEGSIGGIGTGGGGGCGCY